MAIKTLRFMAVVVALAHAPYAAAQDAAAREECLAAYRQAEALWKQQKLSEAARVYQRAVDLAPQAFGAEHGTTAQMQTNLAVLYGDLGKYQEAEKLYRSS